jgi:hypothetical protein
MQEPKINFAERSVGVDQTSVVAGIKICEEGYGFDDIECGDGYGREKLRER